MARALIFNSVAYTYAKAVKTAHKPNAAVYQLNGVKNGK